GARFTRVAVAAPRQREAAGRACLLIAESSRVCGERGDRRIEVRDVTDVDAFSLRREPKDSLAPHVVPLVLAGHLEEQIAGMLRVGLNRPQIQAKLVSWSRSVERPRQEAGGLERLIQTRLSDQRARAQERGEDGNDEWFFHDSSAGLSARSVPPEDRA